MDPPLRERLRWRTATGEGVDSPARQAPLAPTAGLLFTAAALICLAGVVLPGDAELDEGVLLATAGVATALAAFLFIANERVPDWSYHPIGAIGTAVATGAAYGWGSGSAYGPLLYVWVTMFAFYVFSRGAALVHLALMSAAYAVALVIEDPPESPLDGWIATVVTLLGTGLFVSFVRHRLGSMFHRLRDAAQRDPLTDLFNRRGFQGIFDTELERARRTDLPLSLVVGDLDRFKRVNDVHGHAAGDSVLMRVADAIRAAVQEALSSRARDSRLTISFGISTFPLHGQSADGLLRTADQALYAAKRLGRNRSVISSAEVPGILARASRSGDGDAHVELGALLSLAEALDVRDWGSAS